jgi:hypothetical protein
MNTFHRMQVRKTLWHYIADKLTWYRLPAERRKFHPGSGFNLLPPDWYREETDAELRDRIKLTLSKGGK